MKKILFLFSFTFLTFFSFNSNVHANVHTGISYDANEHFNIFYEIKENTEFANFLLTNDLNSLCSHWSISNCYSDNQLFIAYSSDFKNYFPDFSIPEDSKYVVFYSSTSSTFYRSGTTYSILPSSGDYNRAIYFLDKDGYRLSPDINYKLSGDTYSSKIKQLFSYSFSGTSKEDIENFTYFISSFWYAKHNIVIQGLFEKTYVTDVIYDEERLLIDDSKVNENIFTKIKNSWLNLINSDSLIESEQLNLKFFQENAYLSDTKSPTSMYHILNYTNSIIPPSGFVSLNFKIDSKRVDGYLFIPKNINNNLNRNLYGYTSDFPRSSFSNESNISIKQAVSGFSLSNEDSLSALSEKNADYFFQYKRNNKLYDLDYQTRLSKKYPDFKSTTSAIWVSHAIKYDTTLYYNPSAFSVCPLYSTGTTTDSETGSVLLTYNSCTYTNPVTNNEVTLTGDEFYNTISSTNTIGASANIFDDSESQQELAGEYSELYDYNEDGTIKGFNISSTLNEVKTFLNTFIGVIATIFASFTLFFNALPLEIRGLLYFSLVGGAILLFWKLIR